MYWITLFIAGLFEITWAVAMKMSDGFSRFWPSVVMVVAMMFSIVLLGRAIRGIPLGTAYAVWTGIGAVGTALAGMIFFQESAAWLRLFFIFLIIAGIGGLKITSNF